MRFKQCALAVSLVALLGATVPATVAAAGTSVGLPVISGYAGMETGQYADGSYGCGSLRPSDGRPDPVPFDMWFVSDMVPENTGANVVVDQLYGSVCGLLSETSIYGYPCHAGIVADLAGGQATYRTLHGESLYAVEDVTIAATNAASMIVDARLVPVDNSTGGPKRLRLVLTWYLTDTWCDDGATGPTGPDFHVIESTLTDE